MAKRKGDSEAKVQESESQESLSEAESSSDEDTNMLDVDFEWFDPQPEHDFHGIKTLLRQLFDADSQMLDLSALTDLILAQPLLGSTVKVDGNETDPYAFLTVLNFKQHMDKPVVSTLQAYLRDQAGKMTRSPDPSLFSHDTAANIGLILTERLINVPSEVAPPMYRMLLEEIQWAVEEKEPYTFTHFLILSKTYQEVDSVVDKEDDNTRQHKKQRKDKKQSNPDTFYFHPEDEVLHNYALAFGDFDYLKEATDGQSDSRRTFQELGIKPRGHMIVMEAPKLKGALKAMQEYFGQS